MSHWNGVGLPTASRGMRSRDDCQLTPSLPTASSSSLRNHRPYLEPLDHLQSGDQASPSYSQSNAEQYRYSALHFSDPSVPLKNLLRPFPDIPNLQISNTTADIGKHEPSSSSSDIDMIKDINESAQSSTMIHTSESSYTSSPVEDNPLLRQELHKNGRPRRPLNSFMIFSRARRPSLQRKKPNLKVGEIAKELAKEWHEMLPVRDNTIVSNSRRSMC